MNTENPFIVMLLFVGAIIAFIPLCVIGFFYTTIKHLIRLDYRPSKQFFPIFHNIALVLDWFANSVAGELLNDTLLTKDKVIRFHNWVYKYGKWYDTISEVTGVNEERWTLNHRWMIFTRLLWIVLNDNHSILAINRNRKYPSSEKQS